MSGPLPKVYKGSLYSRRRRRDTSYLRWNDDVGQDARKLLGTPILNLLINRDLGQKPTPVPLVMMAMVLYNRPQSEPDQ